MAENFKMGVFSSAHPLHPIFHEAAHAHAEATGADHHNAPFVIRSELGTAAKVSSRAVKNKDEFLAEVRAAKMAGRRFSQDVLSLYERLGGK